MRDHRVLIEGAFNHPQELARNRHRYNKHALIYRGGVVLASILLRLS
jgi:hypothetical protein